MATSWVLPSLLLLQLASQVTLSSRCLLDVPEVNPKRYMKVSKYKFQQLAITLDVSRRVTHQITSHIVKIFLQEELGYPDVVIREHNDRFSSSDEIRYRMSEEKDSDRDSYYSPPASILNTEVWVSPESEFVSWFEEDMVKESGPIGPPGRFGWFIPKKLVQNADHITTYWETFLTPDSAKVFSLTKSEMDGLSNYTSDSSGYFCKEEFCINSTYTPEQCLNQTCAALLAGYGDTTGFVVAHIEGLGLLVRVVWLGPNLQSVVAHLTARLSSVPSRALVFLSFTPSALVLPDDQEYSTVSFPPCGELRQVTGCKYDLHTLTKFYSTVFEKAAAPAYEAYKKMVFSQSDYKTMLLQYRSVLRTHGNSSAAAAHVACSWLRNNTHTRNIWNFHQEEKSVLYIGGIFPLNPMTSVSYYASSIVLAAKQAKDAINANRTLLPNYDLKLLVDDGQCQADSVLRAFIEYIMHQKYKNLVGILGPACSNTLEPLAGVSHFYNTIVISYSAEGSSFSDREKYPYFFRTIGENNQYNPVYLHLLQKLNWKRLASLTEDGQKYTEYVAKLQDLLASKNFTFVMNRKFPSDREKDAMRGYLEEMKSKSVRIIIGDVYDEAARDMMCQAFHLEMTAYHSYVWFLPGWLSHDWYDTDHYNNTVPCTTQQMLQAINGHFSLSHAAWAPDSAIMQTNQTVGEWRKQLAALVNDTDEKTVSNYAGYAYDAVWMYANALEQLSREDPSALSFIHAPNTTRRYVEILEKTDFNGVSGRVQFRGNPSRTSVVEVSQWVDNVKVVVGRFEPNLSASNKDHLAGTLHLNESLIVWLNPERVKPKDGTQHCFLGLAEYFGFEDCNLFLALTNIFAFLILGMIILVGFIFIKRRYDMKVKLTQQIMSSIGLDLLNVGTLEKWEIPRDKVVINRKLGEGAFGYVYGGEANFDSKGWVAVAVKTLKVGSTPEEKLEFLCEAEVMKRFDHKNIVQLLGVCTKNEPVYTVMEFMLYGDLKTFLLARRHLVNERVGEESDEISSKKLTAMAVDVARGLSYLAELKFVHRDVASRNCLVNTARVVKLGDFGMTRPMFDKDYYKFSRKGMLPVRWMSPEALGLGLFTPASDVWSFGVLLYEIITFGSFPFQGMGNHQVLAYVKLGNTLPIPAGIKPQAEALIRSCWTLDYKKRPKASEIVEFMVNNPRLLHPCLDVPLASVQTDDSGSVDLLHPERIRKFSFSLRKRNSSGIFNSPFPNQSQSSCNGFNSSSLWNNKGSAVEPETESPSQLLPVGEEEVPEWNRPLLNTTTVPDQYKFAQPPSTNKYYSYNPSNQDSLL